MSRCSLRGEALQGVVVGQPVSLLLHTQDRYGNSRAAGGEDVDVELSGPAGKLLNPRVPPVRWCRRRYLRRRNQGELQNFMVAHLLVLTSPVLVVARLIMLLSGLTQPEPCAQRTLTA